jgi:Ca2+-binding EF-hand superfamily protein
MQKSLTLLLLMVFGLVAVAYTASPPTKEDYNIPNAESYNAHFGNMDPDKDGKVTWQEFKAFFPKADEKVFASIDRNKDGAIDHDEWHDFKAAYDLKHKD